MPNIVVITCDNVAWSLSTAMVGAWVKELMGNDNPLIVIVGSLVSGEGVE